MSGTMSGGNVLQEFLVKLTYQVNAASQSSFVRSLVESSTSSSQAASAMYRLGLAITNMAKTMAEAGDKLYWMGQRLQSSVQGIESTTYALTQLGASAGEVHSSMEGLGSFVRSHGPAATNYLRSLGVTATDTSQQMIQLGRVFREMGFGPGKEGSPGYARVMAMLPMLGMSENTARGLASGETERLKAQSDAMKARVGLTDKFAESANKLATIFRKLEDLTDALWKRFGQDIMPRLTRDFEKLYNVIYRNIPTITKVLKAFGDALLTIVELFTTFVTTVAGLDRSTLLLIAFFGGLLKAIQLFNKGLLSSPLFWFIAGLTALMLLLSDYQGWKEDQKANDGKHTSALDWSGFENMKTGIDKWGEETLNVCNLFAKILVSLLGITAVSMVVGLGNVAKAIGGIGTAASGLLGFLGRIAPLLALLAFIGPAGGENPEWSEEKNKEFLREREKHKNDPNFLDWARKWIYDNLPDKTGPAGRALNPYGGGGGGGNSTPPGVVSTNTAPGGFMTAQSGSRPSGQELLEYLMSPQGGGWSNVQAAGIIGNLMQESGLNPNALGDGGAAYGMAQWHPDRQALFQAKYGKPIQQASWREQIDFLNYELGTSEGRAGAALRGAGTIESATMAMLGSERPANWDKNPAELNRRLPYARAVMLPGSLAGQPSGGGGGGGGVGMPGGWQPGVSPMLTSGAGGGVSINQTTNISVAPGPTAADTAQRVADHQARVNARLVRNSKSVLR